MKGEEGGGGGGGRIRETANDDDVKPPIHANHPLPPPIHHGAESEAVAYLSL